MKVKENTVKKTLKGIASFSYETTSIFCFYEPELPKQLIKKNIKK